MLNPKQIQEAANYSYIGWEELSKSKKAGCYFCLKIFNVEEIQKEDVSEIIFCPYCGVDSVLGDLVPFELSEENLQQLYEKWFTHTALSHKPFIIDESIFAAYANHSLVQNGSIKKIGYITQGKRYNKIGQCIIPDQVIFHFGTNENDLFYFENNTLSYSSVSLNREHYIDELHSNTNVNK